MGDESAFLAAICAHPADDTARLVYADWLDERADLGDAERAEFIRVQIELERLPEPAELSIGLPGPHTWEEMQLASCATCRRLKALCPYHVLRRRERKLLAGPRPDIYSPAVIWFNDGGGTETWHILFRPEFRRGFVESVSCAAGHWLEHAGAICARHPVRAVRLFDLHSVVYERMWLLAQKHGLDWRPGDEPRRWLRVFRAEWPAIEFPPPPLVYEVIDAAGSSPAAVTRTFVVLGRETMPAVLAAGLPRPRDRHPQRAELMVHRLDVTPLPGGDWRVVVTYEPLPAGGA